MKNIDVSSRENIPLTDEEFVNVLEQMLSAADTDEIKDDTVITTRNIFDTGKGKVVGGFEVCLNIFKEKTGELGVLLKEFILYETEDEWIDAYSRIKKENN